MPCDGRVSRNSKRACGHLPLFKHPNLQPTDDSVPALGVDGAVEPVAIPARVGNARAVLGNGASVIVKGFIPARMGGGGQNYRVAEGHIRAQNNQRPCAFVGYHSNGRDQSRLTVAGVIANQPHRLQGAEHLMELSQRAVEETRVVVHGAS